MLPLLLLTPKTLSHIVAGDMLLLLSLFFKKKKKKKTDFAISCESSAKQMIHVKRKGRSLKNTKKKIKTSSAAVGIWTVYVI